MVKGRKTAWFVGLMLVVAACGGDSPAEQLLESQEGVDDVDLDGDNLSFTVTDDDGNTVSVSGDEDSLTITDEDGDSVAVFGGGDIPDDFPIPTPPGFDVQSVVETPGGSIVILEYASDDYSYEELVAFYDDFSGGDGITITGKLVSEATPMSVSWFLQLGDAQYTIGVHDVIDSVLLVQLTASGSE